MSNPFMARAIALALDNVRSGRGGPFGALVVRSGEVLAEGTNSVTATNDPTAHAEMVVIRAACQRISHFELTGCDIYTTCEPCPMCLGAIYWARPARVFFACTAEDAASSGFDDSFIYKEITRPLPTRKIPMSSLMRAEALEIFRAWDAQSSKVRY